MAMGMSYADFWDGPCEMAVAYRKAYRLKRETENEQAWLQGLYVYDAFAVCLANAFRKKGARAEQYLERPIDIFPLTDAQKKQREREELAKMQKAMENMARAQKARNAKKNQGDK